MSQLYLTEIWRNCWILIGNCLIALGPRKISNLAVVFVAGILTLEPGQFDSIVSYDLQLATKIVRSHDCSKIMNYQYLKGNENLVRSRPSESRCRSISGRKFTLMGENIVSCFVYELVHPQEKFNKICSPADSDFGKQNQKKNVV